MANNAFHTYLLLTLVCVFVWYATSVWPYASDCAYLQYSDGVVEMVMLHGGSGVDGCERRCAFYHELVSVAAMVNIVTQTRNKQSQRLQE